MVSGFLWGLGLHIAVKHVSFWARSSKKDNSLDLKSAGLQAAVDLLHCHALFPKSDGERPLFRSIGTLEGSRPSSLAI